LCRCRDGSFGAGDIGRRHFLVNLLVNFPARFPVNEIVPDADPIEFMRLAILEAQSAADSGDVPIGCVIVHDPTREVIGRGRNRREIDHDPTAHAEIIALRDAGTKLGQWRLLDCTLYVTLEPCPMCAGAIVAARVPRLVYGCADPKAGAVRTLYSICEDQRLNHCVEVTPHICAEECAEMLRVFFRHQRSLGKK
jgi:tRNA(adenine34) deaminase